MHLAGCTYARLSPEIESLKTSYRAIQDFEDTIELHGIECIRRTKFWLPEEHFCYEDDGTEWDDWEDDDSSLHFAPISLSQV